MKKITALLLIITAMTTINASAQYRSGSFSIITKIGTNIAGVTGNELYVNDLSNRLESKTKAGLTFGLDVKYQATRNVAFTAGIGYSRQGYRYADYETPSETTDEYTLYEGISDHHHNIDYLTFPLMVHYYVAPRLAVAAGLQAAFIVNNKYSYETSTFKEYKSGMREYSTKSELHEEEMTSKVLNKTDFSIPLSISYEYMNVVVAATYNIGLSSFTKSPWQKSRNKVIMFTAGYCFNFSE